MNAATIIARTAALFAEELALGYGVETAAHCASRRIIDLVLDEAAGGESLNVHTYWNTDRDYFQDFNSMPSAATWQRLEAAAAAIEEATGICVHLCDLSDVWK